MAEEMNNQNTNANTDPKTEPNTQTDPKGGTEPEKKYSDEEKNYGNSDCRKENHLSLPTS